MLGILFQDQDFMSGFFLMNLLSMNANQLYTSLDKTFHISFTRVCTSCVPSQGVDFFMLILSFDNEQTFPL